MCQQSPHPYQNIKSNNEVTIVTTPLYTANSSAITILRKFDTKVVMVTRTLYASTLTVKSESDYPSLCSGFKV